MTTQQHITCLRLQLADEFGLEKTNDTEEKRKRHAEYQKKWRAANADKVKLIHRKSQQKQMSDPARYLKRKKLLKAIRQKPETRKKRQLQKKRRYGKTQSAMNSHRRWTGREIEMAFDHSLTDTQIANELGRSEQAICLARMRYAEFAPIGWEPKWKQNQ